jgi:hypothetical protein
MIFIPRVFCGNHYVNLAYTLSSVKVSRKGKRVVYVNNLNA